MRISLDGRKPEGEWASLNEPCGLGDGKKTVFETPFPAREMRGLHVMREFSIVAPGGKAQINDDDGKLLREEDDGYELTLVDSDSPVKITFQRPPALGIHITCSVLGRKPAQGEALKILPMTDAIAVQLDEKIPPELRKKKREEIVRLPAVQGWNREAYDRLVVDAYGFLDDNGAMVPWGEPLRKAILNMLGALMLGSFAADRARVLQAERQAGKSAEVSD